MERSQVMLVGLRQPVEGREALEGPSGDKLAALCGLSPPTFRRLFWRMNLLDMPGRTLPDRCAKIAQAAQHARVEAVVMLGTEVCQAMGLRSNWLEWTVVGAPNAPTWWSPLPTSGRQLCLAASPHPSGRNRWWNDQVQRESARDFWTALTARAIARGGSRIPADWARDGRVLRWAVPERGKNGGRLGSAAESDASMGAALEPG